MPDKDSAASKQLDNGYTGSKIEIAGGALNLSAEVPEVKMEETAGEVNAYYFYYFTYKFIDDQVPSNLYTKHILILSF